jgi:hypothetical protein
MNATPAAGTDSSQAVAARVARQGSPPKLSAWVKVVNGHPLGGSFGVVTPYTSCRTTALFISVVIRMARTKFGSSNRILKISRASYRATTRSRTASNGALVPATALLS